MAWRGDIRENYQTSKEVVGRKLSARRVVAYENLKWARSTTFAACRDLAIIVVVEMDFRGRRSIFSGCILSLTVAERKTSPLDLDGFGTHDFYCSVY